MWAERLLTTLRGGLPHPQTTARSLRSTLQDATIATGWLSRRTVFIGAAALAVASCSKEVQRDNLVAVAGADRQPDEPLWSALTNAFVVAVTPQGTRELQAMGSPYADLGSNGLIALANECTFSKVHVGKLAWCRGTSDGFVCFECDSKWSQFGTVITGPATQGLTFLTVSISSEGDVVVDKASRTPGPLAIPDPAKGDLVCDQTFAVPADAAKPA
jgi:hypothetical protein